MCSLRDAATDFKALDVDVYAISLDCVAAVARFHKAQKLNFALLSDPDGGVASKYGALMEGRPYARRVTFVIDDKGVLRHVSDKVDVREHGAELAALVKALRGR